jgi:hypothetical protein
MEKTMFIRVIEYNDELDSQVLIFDFGRSAIHAEFQFTGDCPGFYVENTLEHIMPTLKEYSKIIYDYTMAYLKTMKRKL